MYKLDQEMKSYKSKKRKSYEAPAEMRERGRMMSTHLHRRLDEINIMLDEARRQRYVIVTKDK